MVVSIVGILAGLAIPNYTRFTARAYRSEMRDDIADAAVNPPGSVPPPAPAIWDPHAHGWENVPVALEGGVRMRYWYAISGGGKQLLLQAQGVFPGVGPYTYGETFVDGALAVTTEVPQF